MSRDDFLIPQDDGGVTLTTNGTAYPIPATAVTYAHELLLYNPSTATIMIRATDGTTFGNGLEEKQAMSIALQADQKLYGFCGADGQKINYLVFQKPKPGA